MPATRLLCVIADDYGIGPETSRGILELSARGKVTGSVLLVNSPHAVEAVRTWKRSGASLELGWHPCLTLDAPVAPPADVPSLIGPEGNFWPLSTFLARLALGLVRPADIERELRAQHRRFVDLVGQPPTLVNAHHHVAVFPPVGAALRRVLADQSAPPYLRRVREPWSLLARIREVPIKRALLGALGRGQSRHQEKAGLPGADWLVGITGSAGGAGPSFFDRWLKRVPGLAVELACHPGHHDPSLVGRDAVSADDPLVRRRPAELQLLLQDSFDEACRRAGFVRVPPSAMNRPRPRGTQHAA
jgi:chitin disaccharide deacetylase